MVFAPLPRKQHGLEVAVVDPRQHHSLLFRRLARHRAVEAPRVARQEDDVQLHHLRHVLDHRLLRPLGRAAKPRVDVLEGLAHVVGVAGLQGLPLAAVHVVLEGTAELLPQFLAFAMGEGEVALKVDGSRERVEEASAVAVGAHAGDIGAGQVWKQAVVQAVRKRLEAADGE